MIKYHYNIYIVEELVESGITDIVIVTGRNKNSIEDHFDFSYELENTVVISDFVKKPSKEKAPSILACLGRYLLDGKSFNYFKEINAELKNYLLNLKL